MNQFRTPPQNGGFGLKLTLMRKAALALLFLAGAALAQPKDSAEKEASMKPNQVEGEL